MLQQAADGVANQDLAKVFEKMKDKMVLCLKENPSTDFFKAVQVLSHPTSLSFFLFFSRDDFCGFSFFSFSFFPSVLTVSFSFFVVRYSTRPCSVR
jgi:hypothetical protein